VHSAATLVKTLIVKGLIATCWLTRCAILLNLAPFIYNTHLLSQKRFILEALTNISETDSAKKNEKKEA
jgi:hypothetical protein